MKQFGGFPDRAQVTPVPNIFFSSLLSQIDDIAELKITLHIFWSLYHKKGYPRFITFHELAGDSTLINGLGEDRQPPDAKLKSALEAATRRATILHLVIESDGKPEDIYFLNTESDRRTVAKIKNGEFSLAGWKVREQSSSGNEPLPDIFTLYEQNIGMLTPMIADELREAGKLYPEVWIRDAIKEAVKQNKRKWSYISAILESWSAEGRDDGTYQRDSKTGPDKYIKQKYGNMVQR